MSYAEILKGFIEKSRKTLEQISKECKKKGVSVHTTYISKLRLGQRPAPSDHMSRVLAEVTGGDPEELIIAGYIEKAPEEVRSIIEHYLNHLDLYSGYVVYSMNEELQKFSEDIDNEKFGEVLTTAMEQFKKIPIEQRIDLVITEFNRMVYDDPKFLIDFGKSVGVSDDRINATIQAIKNSSINRITLYDMSKKRPRQKFEWVPTSKIDFAGEPIYFKSPDDSMSGANITKGAKLLCVAVDFDGYKIESGKIYVVGYGEDVIIRRVFVQEDKNLIVLQSENPKYPPLTITDLEDIDLFGLVKSVEFEIENQ